MSIFRNDTGGYLPGPNRTRRILVIGGIVLFAILIVFLLLSVFLKKPAPADSFLDKLRRGDAQGSYALTSKQFQAKTSAKDWQELVVRVSKVYTGKTKKMASKVNPVPDDKNITELDTYELQGTGGPYKIEIYTIKESGKTLISYFNAATAQVPQ